MSGIETALATQASKLAMPALLRWLQGGDVGRLLDAVGDKLGTTTGLSAAGLAPLKQDEAFAAALALFVRTGRMPTEAFVDAIEPHVGPLNDDTTARDAAKLVAETIDGVAH